MYAIVTETFGKFMKLKTKNGEIVIRSKKSVPKEGISVELKSSGNADFFGKIIAGPSKKLPSLKFLVFAEKISKKKQHIVSIAFFLEELKERLKINNEIINIIKKYVEIGEVNEEMKTIGSYLNALSGKFGLRSYQNSLVFTNRETGEFEIYTEDNTIKGVVRGNSIEIILKKIPEDIELLKTSLEKHFTFVSIKKEGMENGIYA
ncbi:hypothetical protein JYK00_09235 [Thermosipho ferrireducens]|uniref:Uncharacterized protein n=1 Tax=Thermosipho ferrireducens TaxID=2571116 RepID=A0ABX7S5Q1_9BACT|nr:hypothetical protein [Thermosipho ferrireducens]QTA37886.1 hypothetical protein JYK00_09235 [Thermosipho ferrireducens]